MLLLRLLQVLLLLPALLQEEAEEQERRKNWYGVSAHRWFVPVHMLLLPLPALRLQQMLRQV
jgi:hypothetical protein